MTNRQHDAATGSTLLQSLLDYYAGPGLMTHPHELAPLLDGLPRDILSLVQVVQGLLVHVFWAERYGLALCEERKGEVQIRTLPQKLRRLRELDDHPLSVARPLEKRLVGNCRDFTVLLCALLQHQGVPARGRCGFGVYFLPGHYEDYWVCEYWKAELQRWVLVDAQVDAFQREAMHVPFDPLDVPRDQFITGGKAWQMCRSGQENPDKFGIFEWHGLYFVRGDLIRDFLALSKIEILPWDDWGLMAGPEQPLTTEDAAILDRMAALTLAGNEAFDEMRTIRERPAPAHGAGLAAVAPAAHVLDTGVVHGPARICPPHAQGRVARAPGGFHSPGDAAATGAPQRRDSARAR